MVSPKLASSTVSSPPPRGADSQAGLAWSALVNVIVSDLREVKAYLDQHDDLARLLPEICASVREAFGPEAELALEVYRDPEMDDRYLTLYVRQEKYDEAIIERIEAARSRYHESLSAVSGHLLLATDLRRPRGLHAA